MSPFRILLLCAGLALAGCQSAPSRPQTSAITRLPAPNSEVKPSLATQSPYVQKVKLATPPIVQVAAEEPVALSETLNLDDLVAEVQARNPTIEAMVAAWQSAAQKYPQAVALDDPMLMAMTAPGSINSAVTEGAYALELRQKLPWLGKRALRGDVAQSEADAAYHDSEESRLAITLMTQMAYYEYYLAHKQLALTEDNVKIMEQLRETARAKFQANQVTQQDLLQASVELAELERRKLELARMKKTAAARINTLLRELPTAPLPPPPSALPPATKPADADLVRQWAQDNRPELAALAHRVEAEEASLALAYKQYYPDVEVFGRYDTFWQPASTQGPLRGQVGVNLNVPIYRRKLQAAVCEAQYRLAQRRAEYEQKLSDVYYEVQSAYDQVDESVKTLELYSATLVPVAEQNVAAARANYEVNKMSFLELAQAQRQLVMLREKQQETLALYHRRLAELERAVGGKVPLEADR